MPKQVEFNGVVHEFPDDFSDADISAALSLQPVPAHEPARESSSVGGFVRNIGSDAVNTVSGLASMVLHPIDTATAFKDQAVKSLHRQAMINRGDIESIGMHKSIPQLMGMAAEHAYEKPVGTALLVAGSKAGPSKVGLAPIKGGLERLGVRAMRGALKVNTGDINKMVGSQRGMDAVADAVAKDALDAGVTVTKHGARRVQRQIDATDAARTAAIDAAPDVPVPGSRVAQLRSLRPVVRKYGPASQTLSEADTAAVRGVRSELRRNPALQDDLTPRQLNTMNRGDNRALAEKYGKGSVGDAELDALKAITGARSASLESVVPGTKELGTQMRKLIDVRKVLDVARKRGDNRDVIGINDMLAIAAGNPKALIASTAMRPAAQSMGAHALYRTGKALPSQIDLAALYKLALLEQLTGASEPEPSR